MVFNITSDLVLSSVKANNSEVAVQNTSEETMAVAVGSKVGGDEYGTGFIFPGNYVFNDKTVTFSDTIPDYLYGKEFIQGNMGGHSDTSSATVETAGVIYVLTRVDSTAQDSEITNFLQQGFVKVNEIAAYALSSGLDRDIAVLKKNVSVGETITWSRWAIVVADSGISFTQRASVKIDLAIRTFEEGQELYHDRTGKLIGKVPEILKNVPYVYSSIDSGINNAPATVERAGYVYIMTPIAGKSTSQQTILEGQGFTKIGMIGKYNFASDYSDPIAVMRKYCNPGETISFGRLGYMIADEATYSSVTSDKFGAAVISTGLPAFNDRTSMPFTDAFPTYLKGKEYLRGNIDGSSTATVTSAGTMYVLTRADASNKDSQLNYFLGQGFVKVDEIAANVFIDRAVAVLKKQVTVGETFTWSRWALLISGSGIELKERAQVMTSCPILGWEKGQKVFADRTYALGEPYPALEGTSFLQGGIDEGTTVTAKVSKTGWIYVLTPMKGVGTSQQEALEQQGFTAVGKIAKGLYNEQSDIMAVMAKNCAVGETISFGRFGIMIADEATDSSVTQDGNGAKIEFLGGSLRMDYENYNRTSLRFGYKISLPEGARLDNWSWQYTTTDPNQPLTGNGVNKTVNDDGSINANLVITGVPSTYYNLVLTATMKIEYTLSDGTKCTLEETVAREKSVNLVAEKILESELSTEEEKEYAISLLGR